MSVVHDAESQFQVPGYDDSAFGTGSAAFGSGSGCSLTASTAWPLDTDMLLRRELVFPPGVENVKVAIAIDNAASVYWNGSLVGSTSSGGCASQDMLVVDVPNELLVHGANTLAVRGSDFGVVSFLDVEVSGDASALAASEFFGSNPSLRCPCLTDDTPASVNTQSGNEHMALPGIDAGGRGPGLRFEIAYNSGGSAVSGLFGNGWSSTYDMSLVLNGDGTRTVNQETGSTVPFFPDGSGGWVAPARHNATLSLSGSVWTFTRNHFEVFEFNSLGELTKLDDLNGNAVTISRDGSHRPVDVVQGTRELHFDYSGSTTTITDPLTPNPRSVTAVVDGNGDLVSYTDVGGGVYTMTYASHLLTTVVRPLHAAAAAPKPALEYHYDSLGRVDWEEDELNRRTSLYYDDPVAGATRVVEPEGDQRVDYYTDGVLTKTTKGFGTSDAVSVTHTFAAATLVLLREVVDPGGLNVTSTFKYDSRGNRTETTDPEGRVTQATYNSFDQPLTVVDGEGVVTEYEYGAEGQLELATAAAGTAEEAVTDPVYGDVAHPEDLTTLVDPLGKSWVYEYDTSGYQTSATDPEGNETTWSYTSIGQIADVTAPKGNLTGATPEDYRTHFTYDDHGDVLTVTNPADEVVTFTYDASRNALTVTDNDGETTEHTYDDVDQLVSTERADGSTVDYAYDANGRRTSWTSGTGGVWATTYDAVGRVATETDPNSEVSSYSWDDNGNLLMVEQPDGDCQALVKAGCITYGYDLANQLTSIDYSDPATPDVTSVTYDDAGRRTAQTQATAVPTTQTWSWDALGRLVSHEDTLGNTTDYEWDAAGKLAAITYPGEVDPVTYGYDDAGRATTVTDWLGNVTTFSPDEHGNYETITFPTATGNVDEFTFDQADRMLSATWNQDSSPLASVSYDPRDPEGLLDAAATTGLPGPDETYAYDDFDQLTAVNAASADYDDAGNLIARLDGATQAFDAAQQLCWSSPSGTSGTCGSAPGDATTFTYDARGNRTAAASTIGSTAFAYDQASRLTAVDNVTYGYDADGLRVTKSVDETEVPTPLVTDGFGRMASNGFGTADLGGAWTVSGTSSNYSANGTVGLVSTTANGTRTAYVGGVTSTDTDVSVAVALDKPATGGGVYVGLMGRRVSTNNDYRAELKFLATGEVQLRLSSVVGGAGTIVAATTLPALSYTANTVLRVRMEVTGTSPTTLRAKAWVDGTTEPTGWMIYGTDSAAVLQTAGAIGISDFLTSTATNAPVTLKVDNLTATTPVPLTGTLANDGFGRSVSNSLGNADIGGAWTPTGSSFSVNGSAGLITAAAGQARTAHLGGITTTEADTTATVAVDKTPTGGGTFVSVVGRRLSATDDYRAEIKLIAGADAQLRLLSTVGGTATILDLVTLTGLTYTANTVLRVRIEVTGTAPTTLRAKVWVDGTTEPTGWTVEDTDTASVLQHPGSVGTSLYLSSTATNGPATLSIDNLNVEGPEVPIDDTQFMWTQHGGLPLMLATVTDSIQTQVIYDPSGMPLAEITGTDVTWYHHDQLGSTRVLTNETGDAIGTYTYDPFGALATHTGTTDPVLDFAGQYTDHDTGLQYLRARHYDPATGQFLTRDPLRALTREPYGYALNDPINLTDPTGLSNPLQGGAGWGSSGQGARVAVAAGLATVAASNQAGEGFGASEPASPSGPLWEVSRSLSGVCSSAFGGTNWEQMTRIALAASGPSDMPDFDDPTNPPGDDWEWRGGDAGGWYNPKTRESLHPDLNHPQPIGPHYDWKVRGSKDAWRVFPDGTVKPK